MHCLQGWAGGADCQAAGLQPAGTTAAAAQSWPTGFTCVKQGELHCHVCERLVSCFKEGWLYGALLGRQPVYEYLSIHSGRLEDAVAQRAHKGAFACIGWPDNCQHTPEACSKQSEQLSADPWSIVAAKSWKCPSPGLCKATDPVQDDPLVVTAHAAFGVCLHSRGQLSG